MSLADFAHELVQDATAMAEADSSSTHDSLAERVLADLEVAGHIEDWYVAYYRAHGLEVSGYGLNPGLETLDLFLVQFRQQPLMAKIGSKEIVALTKRVTNYVEKAAAGLSLQVDEATEAHDMSLAVRDALRTVSGIRIFIITNDIATVRKAPLVETIMGHPVTVEVWDLVRLHRLATSGVLHEPILVEFDPPLPFLSTPETDQNYSVFLAIIRGDTLGDIYRQYGARLLELNVRSFLQLKGTVNRGIRETLINSPERFLAYNNGISATASRIELVQLPDGTCGIGSIQDLQVVNGGQTTASIHNALAKNEADLSQVFVQMKLTVVQPKHINDIVPEISRFSNTQNRVTIVDFSSNEPYHVELEKITRSLWAPAAAGTGLETKWFFERARGQYADALSRERTSAKQRAFRVQFPVRQKFLKTDVAKWEHSWSQKPWLVSRGAEKNFRSLMSELAGKSPTTDIDYVKRLLAKGILFRATERLVTEQHFGGYRANIVTYAIAKVANVTSQRIDLGAIWRDQSISDPLVLALTEVSVLVNKVITEPPSGTTHVGEWSKKEACWARVVAISWVPPKSLERELLDLTYAKLGARSEEAAGMTEKESSAFRRVSDTTAESWFALSRWAKETSNLESWQRSLAFSLGRLAARSGKPSVKQASQGAIILDSASRLGFRA
jgi:hypothetical protein